MRINPGTSSIQMLKAQQAWEARKTAKPSVAEPSQTSSPAIEIAKPEFGATQATSQTVSPQWNRKVQDIQQVAEKAGFVGVSEQDIRRAYTHGESLLADYRV